MSYPGEPSPSELTSLRQSFGRRVRNLREGRELSQESLAEISGLDRKTISRTENGVHSPRLDHIFAIALALSVDPSELFAKDAPEINE